MPPAKSVRVWRASGEPERFFAETVVLRAIEVEDPGGMLMEVGEAAALLGVKQNTVVGHVDRGNLTVIRRSGSTRRWLLRSEVEALAASRAGE